MCVLYYNMSVMKIFCEVFTDQNYLPKNLVKAVSVTIFGLFLGKLSQKNLACTTTMMTVLLCVNFGSKLLMIIKSNFQSQQGSLSKKVLRGKKIMTKKYQQKSFSTQQKRSCPLMMKKVFSMRRFMWSFNTNIKSSFTHFTHI